MKPAEHLRIVTFELEPGQEWAEPSSSWRILRLTKGDAYWLEPTKPQAIAQGELLVLAPGAPGILRASQLNKVVVDWFSFDPASLSGFFTMSERYVLERAAGGPMPLVQVLPGTHPLAQSMTDLLEAGATAPELIRRGQVLLVALRLLAPALPSSQPASHRGAPAQDRFRQIISHMPDIELIQHSAEDLARMCGCTTRHFSRLFHEQFGESPRSRQTELRLLKARDLLNSSEQRIVQIASDCGYRSLSLFNSLFKRRFGMTPSQWRQESLSKAAKPSLQVEPLLEPTPSDSAHKGPTT